ncbi:YihY/virulence factor BrkB family protein [Amphibacillus cookii]|uniref:YihY/virulence factor BrkB family protein n=1 Tax=Amphibacillus cookii TaxID=767787 RepID=UPI00195E6DC8|nr:YihY/virulence factor BrkB family protein [Amphibacillus cookii]MBM7542102.1 membrane protein [Amphibacillus cookii]
MAKSNYFDSVKEFILALFKRFSNDEVTSLSAQLSYFFLLSLFPLLIFLVTLLGYLPIDYQEIMNMMRTYIPSDSMTLIENSLDQVVQSSSGGLLSLGIIGTLWSASNGINAIMRALNKAYGVEENRSFIFGRLIAISLLISVLILIVVALLLPVFGRMIGLYIFSFFGASEEFIEIWNTLRWVISSSVFFIVFLYLYRLAPNTKVYIKDTLFGALFATLGWQVSSFGFSFYVNTMGDYSATYGSLGGVIVMMIWFYISGIIIITGGEINAMVAAYRGRK